MHFSRANPIGWGLKAKLTSGEANALDIDHAKAINGDDGSTHSPANRIIIEGDAGVQFDCPVGGTWDAAVTLGTGSTWTCLGTTYLGDGAGHDGTLDVKDGSSLMFRSGAGILQFAGATWVLSGNTAFGSAGVDANGGAGHHVLSGGKLYVDGSGFVVVRAGGTITMGGTLTATSGSMVSLSGAPEQASGSFTLAAGVPMALHGDVTLESDGSLVTESGSVFTLGGAVTIGATGAIATTGTGAITIATGGSFTAASGSTTTINGTLAGAITRTAAVTKSGSTANDYVRCTSGADSNTTYAATFDILFVNISVDRTYKLGDGSPGQVVRLAVNGTLATAELTVADSDNNVICMLSEAVMNVSAKKGGHVDLVWHSGAWRVIGGYGLYTP